MLAFSVLFQSSLAQLAKLDWNGRHIAGDPPSNDNFLHLAMYEERPQHGAVVHLHAAHSVGVSVLADTNPDDALTAYYVIRIGALPMMPYYAPGDLALAYVIEELKATARHYDRCGAKRSARWMRCRLPNLSVVTRFSAPGRCRPHGRGITWPGRCLHG